MYDGIFSATNMTGDYAHASLEEMEREMEGVAHYNRSLLKSLAKWHRAAFTPISRCFVSY